MNKHAQYYPTPSYSFVHPVLIIGIAIFVLPILLPAFGVKPFPEWLKVGFNFVGIITILFGGVLSISKASN